MELIEFENLPKDVQKRFKKEHDMEMDLKYKSMGFDPSRGALNMDWETKLRETCFFKESGNVYFSFKPKRI